VTKAAVTEASAAVKRGAMPNLASTGPWGGRRRRIKLLRDSRRHEGWRAYPLGWDGETIYFHFDTVLDMPYPYYESLRNMVHNRIKKEESIVNGKVVVITTEEASLDLAFSDMGDTPGTEHLPISMIDWFQKQAYDNGLFAQASRRVLTEYLRLLLGQTEAGRFAKDRNDDELRDRVLSFIGIDPLELEAA
jgi:hypothetical protein